MLKKTIQAGFIKCQQWIVKMPSASIPYRIVPFILFFCAIINPTCDSFSFIFHSKWLSGPHVKA